MTVGAVKRRLARRASRAVLGGFRPPDSPLASWFGRVQVARADEAWPTSRGQPMVPLVQFNLTEPPYLPDRLKDIAFLTVFLDADELPCGTPNGDRWLLRAYGGVDDLVPVQQPDTTARLIKPFPIRWELIEKDYPCREDVAGTEFAPEVEEDYDELFENQNGTKLGGWPTLIQSEIFWAPENRHPANPEYLFQIASEPKAHFQWGDAGIGYFGRGTGDHPDAWTLEWQCN